MMQDSCASRSSLFLKIFWNQKPSVNNMEDQSTVGSSGIKWYHCCLAVGDVIEKVGILFIKIDS